MNYKSYEHRGLVKKWLPYWEQMLRSQGKKAVVDYLRHRNGKKTKMLPRKDRLGLLQALDLQGEK